MRKQDHLTELIHSLSPNEKKYFRQFIDSQSGGKSYEKLFDVLQTSDHYDADVISKLLKKSKKNLADDKEYLQEILMRSLRNFHANSLSRAKIFNGLMDSEILANRGMIDFAIAHIRKLKKGMPPGEENLFNYLVLAQEIVLVRTATPGGLMASEWLKKNTNDLLNMLPAAAINNRLVSIGMEVQDLSADLQYIDSPVIQTKAATLIEEAHELVKGKKLPSHTFISYHHLLALYYCFLGVDMRLSIVHAKKGLQKYESENIEFRRYHVRTKYIFSSIMLQAYFELQDFKNVELQIQYLKNWIAEEVHSELIIKAEMRVFTFTLLLYTATQKYTEAIQFIQNNKEGFKKKKPPGENIAVVQFIKAVNLFHLKKYDEALTALQPLLESDPLPQLPETRTSARALNLMIQYEIGNFSPLHDYLRAVSRYFKKENLMTKEVRLFLDLMKHLSRHQNRSVAKAYLQKLNEEVYDAHRFELIGYFVLIPWLNRML